MLVEDETPPWMSQPSQPLACPTTPRRQGASASGSAPSPLSSLERLANNGSPVTPLARGLASAADAKTSATSPLGPIPRMSKEEAQAIIASLLEDTGSASWPEFNRVVNLKSLKPDYSRDKARKGWMEKHGREFWRLNENSEWVKLPDAHCLIPAPRGAPYVVKRQLPW